MIAKITDKLKLVAINTPMVNMSSIGDISLYNNKATIQYPYVNIDVVNSRNDGGAKVYTIRLYVCDRNEPYIAYNKTEQILDSIMNNSEIDESSYTTNFFSLDFQDDVHGVWTDLVLSTAQQYECLNLSMNIAGTVRYIMLENGDLIITQDTNENITTEDSQIIN
jgi:hypothetical protein